MLSTKPDPRRANATRPAMFESLETRALFSASLAAPPPEARTETVDHNETITIHANRTESVAPADYVVWRKTDGIQ